MDNFFKAADIAGWDCGQQIDVLLQYIENQSSDDAFRDFLSEESGGAAGDDAGFDATVDATGWCGSEQIDVLLQYIENQCDDDAFKDHLLEEASGAINSCGACGTLIAAEDAFECEDCIFSFCSKCHDASKGNGCTSHKKVEAK